jgi:hypothetical protein
MFTKFIYEVHVYEPLNKPPINNHYMVSLPFLDNQTDYHFLSAAAVFNFWKNNYNTNFSEEKWNNLTFQVCRMTEDKHCILVPGELNEKRSIYGRIFNNKLEEIK